MADETNAYDEALKHSKYLQKIESIGDCYFVTSLLDKNLLKNVKISEILNVEIHGPHINDKYLLDQLKEQGEMFGMPSRNCSPDKWLNEGDQVTIGNDSVGPNLFCLTRFDCSILAMV